VGRRLSTTLRSACLALPRRAIEKWHGTWLFTPPRTFVLAPCAGAASFTCRQSGLRARAAGVCVPVQCRALFALCHS
jgi:hypothetical protein